MGLGSITGINVREMNLKTYSKLRLHLFICAILSTVAVATGTKSETPSLVRMQSPRRNSVDECLRTSHYTKPQSGYVCRNLGKCYQYHCEAIARHCTSCGNDNSGPCIDYSKQGTTKDYSQDSNKQSDISDKNIISLLQMRQEIVQANQTETTERYKLKIEAVGNAIVHLRAGDRNCSGFLVSVKGNYGERFLIFSAAQCVVNFEVECLSERSRFGDKFQADVNSGRFVDDFITYKYNHSIPCFSDYDADVTKVNKGFRSYVVFVTSYTGESFTIPLNSNHVIVPRGYMECQDCRNDFAAIKISDETAKIILRGSKAFDVTSLNENIKNNTPMFVKVKAGFPPKLLRKAADLKLCTVSNSTKGKMCFQVPYLPSEYNRTGLNSSLLVGSPIFLPELTKTGISSLRAIGIFTGYFTSILRNITHGGGETEHKVQSVVLTKNTAVPLSRDILSFLKQHPSLNLSITTSQNIHPRYDCYMAHNIGASFHSNHNQLCLCATGWTREASACTTGKAKLLEECDWDGTKYACVSRMRVKLQNNVASSEILKEVTVPGTVKQLDLRGKHIFDVVELKEMLRHVVPLRDLILDYNDVESLPKGLFDQKSEMQMLSMKRNKIKTIHTEALRTNRKLMTLNLAYNELTTLPSGVFHRLRNLNYVNFQGNKITKLPPKLFRRNNELKKIDLSGNYVARFPARLLMGLSILSEFWMNHNFLQRIPQNSFKSCGQLHLVDLSYNRLNSMSRKTFATNPELQFVNLNNNKLQKIPGKLFAAQKNLKSVSVLRNPLLRSNATESYFTELGIAVN